MKFIYKVILTVNATMMLLIVYLIKEEIKIPMLNNYQNHISYLFYLCSTIVYSKLCLWISNFLSEDCIKGGIVDVEPANNSYLPSYLGYFFIALSINQIDTLIWMFIIIYIFTFNSQTLYFNPTFLIFNYKFYYITIENGMKLFVITKKNINTIENLQFNNLRRINNFTFIDWGK